MAKFWNMAHDADEGFLTLFGEISDASWFGDEVTPRMFKQELDDMGELSVLNVSINSGGGDVFAGQAIYNMLKNHRAHVVVRVEGLAASIASVIAMAGDEIIMPENAVMMIHEAWSGAIGNKHDLRKMADTLDVIDGTIRSIYAAKTGLTDAELAEMMAAETWLTAEDAIGYGFCTEVEANKKIAASVKQDGTCVINGVEIDMKRFKNAADIFGKEDDEEKRKDAPEEDDGDDAESGDATVGDKCDPNKKKCMEEDDEAEDAEEHAKKEHCNGATTQPVDADKELIERKRALIAALMNDI